MHIYGTSTFYSNFHKWAAANFMYSNDNARAAIRLGFHDAGAWPKTNKANGQDFGGADGSIILGFGEESRPENTGLQTIIKKLAAVKTKFNVGAADLVQFAVNHATVTCVCVARAISSIP